MFTFHSRTTTTTTIKTTSTATTTVAAMSSRTRNFRRRADDDDENDNESNGKETPSTATTKPSSKSTAISTTTAAKAAKPKKPQTPKLLSFADDEDTETPSRQSSTAKFDKPPSRLSKPSSSSSHKITSIKDRIPPPSTSLPSNVQPQAGLYTKEALLELQKNTKTLVSSRPTDRKPHSEPVIVLKGLVKPVDTLKEVKELDEEEEGRGKGRSTYMRDRDDAETQLASLEIGRKSTEESGSLIPDQATINAIRAKRERLRQSRAAAPDYISLDGGSNHGEAEGLSDEEPEFQGRIAMFGEKIESGKKGVFEDFDERGIDTSSTKDDDTEDDVEEKIWEEEQFRKGLGKRMDNGSNIMITSSSNAPVVHSVQQQKYVYPAAAVYTPAPSVPPPPSIGGAFGASQGLDVMPISQQAEVARKALKENVNRLKESHGRTLSSLTRTEENLSSSLLNITSLEKSLSAAGEKFIFMQKLRDFVSVICDFLQHKAPFIEELEEQMQKLHEERASAVLERRVADNDDEMMEIEAAVNAARSILREGGSSAAMIAAATSAAQAAAAAVREEANLPVKLDEFGRDMNLQNRMDMERRAEARKRRKARSDSMRMSSMETDSSYQKIEGESSTDESDSESTAYQSNCESLLQTADQIFSDAAEEFSQLPLVKAWFEKWKKDYSSSYRDAYMSLSVPAIFGPYVRLELLKWDPLHVELDFDNMKWHSLLFDYGSNENGFSPDDADANLVPELVEKVALPILHHEIAHCWDMLSTKETMNAVAATSLLATYIPASSEAFGELLVAIRTRLADAVANVAVPTWSPLVMKAVPNAARVAAYQFGVCVRLMKNVCLWKEILSMPVLEKLALDELLSPKVLPHLRSITTNVHDAVTRTERIIASMSGVWAGSSVTGGCSHKLQSLVDYVLLLGKTLEKKQASGVSESETSGLARRLKKMLVELNEYDEARAISRIFRLKEAL